MPTGHTTRSHNSLMSLDINKPESTIHTKPQKLKHIFDKQYTVLK